MFSLYVERAYSTYYAYSHPMAFFTQAQCFRRPSVLESILNGASEMKRLFVCIAVMLLFSASAVFAGEEGGYTMQPRDPESGNGSQAQRAKPDPGSQKCGGPTSVGQGLGSSSRQEEPDNAVKSRWQIDMGGFVGMDVGHGR